jgi:hypothetical protein
MNITDLISKKGSLEEDLKDQADHIISVMRLRDEDRNNRSYDARLLLEHYHESMEDLENMTVLLHTFNNTITYEGRTIQEYMAEYDTLNKRIKCLNYYINSMTEIFKTGTKLLVDLVELQEKRESYIMERGRLYVLLKHLNWVTQVEC